MGALVKRRKMLITLAIFAVAASLLLYAYSVSAEDEVEGVDLNNGQFRVEYLGIGSSFEIDSKPYLYRTVGYAVTNNGCTTEGTTSIDSSVPTTGNGRGKGTGGGPKEPKCAGMSHFSVGIDFIDESHLVDPLDGVPIDASGACINCYEVTWDHPGCGSDYVCLEGTFTPTYGGSGATKFDGLKFSKSREEESLPQGFTFIFQFSYQSTGQDGQELYQEGDVDVLVKPGNQFYIGGLSGPIKIVP